MKLFTYLIKFPNLNNYLILISLALPNNKKAD